MDEINQIGKYLNETKQRADYAVDRYIQPRKRVERVRDVFDSVIPFEMGFQNDYQDQRVKLDLFFQEGLGTTPTGGGGGGGGSGCSNNTCGTCEAFVMDCDFDQGDLIITLSHSYRAGSVRAYLNGTRISVTEISPAQATVQINKALEIGDKLVVCYNYNSGGGGGNPPPAGNYDCCSEVRDDFDRVTVGDFGSTADWTWSADPIDGIGPGFWDANTDGGFATWRAQYTGFYGGQTPMSLYTTDTTISTYPYYKLPENFTIVLGFMFRDTNTILSLNSITSGGLDTFYMSINPSPTYIIDAFYFNGHDAASNLTYDWQVNTAYIVKWERVSGKYNRFKVWPSSGTEPTDWRIEVSADDSTSTGFYMVIANDSPRPSNGVDIDYFIVQDLDTTCDGSSCSIFTPEGPCSIMDSFTRTGVPSGEFGTADNSQTWIMILEEDTFDAGYTYDVRVEDDIGKIFISAPTRFEAPGGNVEARLGSGPVNKIFDIFDIQFDLRTEKQGNSTELVDFWNVQINTDSAYEINIGIEDGSEETHGGRFDFSLVGNSDLGFIEEQGHNLISGTWYTFRVQWQGPGRLLRSKYWPTNASEPDWMFQFYTTLTPFVGSAANRVSLLVEQSGGSIDRLGSDYEIWIDNIVQNCV